MSASASSAAVARCSRQALMTALAALALAYLVLFRADPQRGAAIAVFVAPPLLLLALMLAGRTRAAFWAGVAGLIWFSHAVMLAWVQPDVRGLAFCIITLALVIVFASSLPGLHARFAGKSP